MERPQFSGRLIALLAAAAFVMPTCWAFPQQRATGTARKAPVQRTLQKAPAPPAKRRLEPPPAHLRDPFAALIRVGSPGGGHPNLPPGIAGLQVATLKLQGMVKDPEAMIAIVSNPENRVYFLHDGDHLYDGVVERIGLNEITFRQETKDAFGRVVEREVTKRLYPIAGE